MLQLDQIWTILIEGKYSPVHDVIGPRPMSRDQKQKNAFYLNGLNLLSVFSVQQQFKSRFEEI